MSALENGAAAAMPVPLGPGERYAGQGLGDGLTKREMLAALAMQGILANRVYDPPRRTKLAGMAKDAVSAADALLAELAKPRGAAP